MVMFSGGMAGRVSVGRAQELVALVDVKLDAVVVVVVTAGATELAVEDVLKAVDRLLLTQSNLPRSVRIDAGLPQRILGYLVR
jgi:hypothetical protein